MPSPPHLESQHVCEHVEAGNAFLDTARSGFAPATAVQIEACNQRNEPLGQQPPS